MYADAVIVIAGVADGLAVPGRVLEVAQEPLPLKIWATSQSLLPFM